MSCLTYRKIFSEKIINLDLGSGCGISATFGFRGEQMFFDVIIFKILTLLWKISYSFVQQSCCIFISTRIRIGGI
jgi:hypothetical protein